MPNSWFRLYAEIRRDPKVQTMPECLQLRLIWLLTLRCEGPTEKLSVDELRYGLACNADVTLESLHETFLSKGFIEKDWSIVNWGKRQYVSDSSTERVRKFRALAESKAQKQDETLQKRYETENVTHQNRTEQIRTKQKTSSRGKREAKRPTKTDINKSRHAEFKAAIGLYWKSKNGDTEMPWDAAEGRMLEIWLRSCPTTTIDQFRGFLRNRFKSEVNHTERPSRWIGNITNFAAEPIDKFGKPKSLNGGSNGAYKQSPTKQRVDATRSRLAQAAIDRGLIDFDRNDGVAGQAVPLAGFGK